ncbi:hypothetical protein BDV39DRAFT_173511, partial [Aspergillus sergii]
MRPIELLTLCYATLYITTCETRVRRVLIMRSRLRCEELLCWLCLCLWLCLMVWYEFMWLLGMLYAAFRCWKSIGVYIVPVMWLYIAFWDTL